MTLFWADHLCNPLVVLRAGAVGGSADLGAARAQMAISLGWHIVLACLGVGLPGLTAFVEWRGIRTGSADYARLARRWARAMGVLFAVGAVSGTILSFEMGLLWPGLMSRYGQVMGLPFALEGFAFFIEAIFVGIYLYGWDRLPPRVHLLTAVPMMIAGVASAFVVVTANAWMNQPRGFTVTDGRITSVSPLRAMFNPATPPQTIHMILASLVVSGFLVASVYAVAMLRGRRDSYHRTGFLVAFTLGAALMVPQIIAGDYAAKFLADYQPVKLAAAEGLFETGPNAPLHLGGIVIDGRIRYAVEIPGGLSILAGYTPHTVVEGLNDTPIRDRPPVNPVHWSFDTMVGIGFALALLALWLAWSWWRRRDLPGTDWFLRAAALTGLASVVALETGWVVTEVGRQPWIVFRVMRTSAAVNPAPGLVGGLIIVLVTLAALTVASALVLRRMACHPDPAAGPTGGTGHRDGSGGHRGSRGSDGGGVGAGPDDRDEELAPQEPTTRGRDRGASRRARPDRPGEAGA